MFELIGSHFQNLSHFFLSKQSKRIKMRQLSLTKALWSLKSISHKFRLGLCHTKKSEEKMPYNPCCWTMYKKTFYNFLLPLISIKKKKKKNPLPLTKGTMICYRYLLFLLFRLEALPRDTFQSKNATLGSAPHLPFQSIIEGYTKNLPLLHLFLSNLLYCSPCILSLWILSRNHQTSSNS